MKKIYMGKIYLGSGYELLIWIVKNNLIFNTTPSQEKKRNETKNKMLKCIEEKSVFS